uniref:Uncharacterized protein n=1 Tax=Zea mays TaxID=4577 RepID=A0A804MUT4_MAIZE
MPSSVSPANVTESISSFSAYMPMYRNTLSVRRPDMARRLRPLQDRTIAPKPSSSGCPVTASADLGLRMHSLKDVSRGQYLAIVISAVFVIRTQEKSTCCNFRHEDRATNPSSVTVPLGATTLGYT